jgi:hypothetical protein
MSRGVPFIRRGPKSSILMPTSALRESLEFPVEINEICVV